MSQQTIYRRPCFEKARRQFDCVAAYSLSFDEGDRLLYLSDECRAIAAMVSLVVAPASLDLLTT